VKGHGPMTDGNLYWGDLHNHCSVGLFHYAKGSLARAIDIAREHLDFFAFTGHSQWHDMPLMPDDAQLKWQEGFDHHTRHWPKTREMIAAANAPGEFVTFLGYEWHSSAFGDRCIVFPGDDGDLIFTDDVAELEAHARRAGAMLFVHHIGYREGPPGRGINWERFHGEHYPLIEIVSEHGCAERDRGGWPYVSHSLGPRTTRNTYQHALAQGHHCGVTGGSDDHFGFPGAYGEGLVGVYARELTRPALFEALRARRTLASTGDRTSIHMTVNDGFIGDILPPADRRHVTVAVKAWDEIDKVELIKNNRTIHRWFPDPAAGPLPGRRLLRIEYGWGPWTALGTPRTADWDFRLKLTGESKVLSWQPCLQCAPLDEDRRHRLSPGGDQAFAWRSYTSRAGAYREVPTNALVFELDARADDRLRLTLAAPARLEFDYALGEIDRSSRIEFTGGFPAESFLVHRLVPEAAYMARFELDDTPSGDGEDCYYVRVTGANGHLAWCSPIWVGGEEATAAETQRTQRE